MNTKIEIASEVFEFEFSGDYVTLPVNPYWEWLSGNYTCRIMNKSADLKVRFVDIDQIAAPSHWFERKYGIQYGFVGGCHFFRNVQSCSMLDLTNKRLEVAFANEVPVGERYLLLVGHLRNALSTLLIKKGGILLHCSALVRNDRAVLFCGPSGTGKSTIAQWLQHAGWQLLNDECNALVPQGGGVQVHATPFSNLKALRRAVNTSAETAHLFYIVQDTIHSATAPTRERKIFLTLAGLYALPSNEKNTGILIDNAINLCQQIRATVLHFGNNNTLPAFIDTLCRW